MEEFNKKYKGSMHKDNQSIEKTSFIYAFDLEPNGEDTSTPLSNNSTLSLSPSITSSWLTDEWGYLLSHN